MRKLSNLDEPISGEAVSNYLSSSLKGNEIFIVRDIETLCTKNCESLGRLWLEVSNTHNIEITLDDLVCALRNADQVVTLQIFIKNSPSRELFIDDGEFISSSIED